MKKLKKKIKKKVQTDYSSLDTSHSKTMLILENNMPETKATAPQAEQPHSTIPEAKLFDETPDEAIADLKASVDDGEAPQEFMKPKKRGRKPGQKNKPKDGASPEVMHGLSDKEALLANKRMVRPVWEMLSGVGVKLAEDERAALGAAELEVLVDTSAAVIHQYLPELLGQHANLVVLSLTFGQWSLRVYMLRQANLERLKAEYRAKNGGIPPRQNVRNAEWDGTSAPI